MKVPRVGLRQRRCGWPEDPWACPWALKESVDGWPMAIIIPKTIGGQPKPVAVSGRDGRLVTSNRGLYVAVWADLPGREFPRLQRTAPWEAQWGQMDGP